MLKEIVFERAKFILNDNGILICEFFNKETSYKMELETAKQYSQAISKLCNGKPRPFLVDLSNAKGTYTTQAAKHMANTPKLKKVRLREVFVYKSMSSRLLILSYKRIYDPITPYKMTKNMNKAIEHCVEIKNKFDEA